LLETKAQTSRETRPRTPQAEGPQVHIADTGTLGGALFLPGTQDMYRHQVSHTVVSVLGKHDVTFGADYNAFNLRNNSFTLARNGAYVFSDLEAFVERRPLLYAQNVGLNGYTAEDAALLESVWQHEAALYVQDRFRPTSRLTIGLGLRYDAQINPQPQAGIAGSQVPVGAPAVVGNRVQLTYASVPQAIPHDLNNWGPRSDFAYQLSGDGVMMVKGSAGLGSTERDTEASFGPSDPSNLEADYGITELDERHQFKSYVVFSLPRDITCRSGPGVRISHATAAATHVDSHGDRAHRHREQRVLRAGVCSGPRCSRSDQRSGVVADRDGVLRTGRGVPAGIHVE